MLLTVRAKLDMNHIMKRFAVLTAFLVSIRVPIACFPPDDIDYDYEFAMGKGVQLYNKYQPLSACRRV